jgi:hypothetical protein
MTRIDLRIHYSIDDRIALRPEPISPEGLAAELMASVGVEYALNTARHLIEKPTDEDERAYWIKVRAALSDRAITEPVTAEDDLSPKDEAFELVGSFGLDVALEIAVDELAKARGAGKRGKVAHWKQVRDTIKEQKLLDTE